MSFALVLSAILLAWGWATNSVASSWQWVKRVLGAFDVQNGESVSTVSKRQEVSGVGLFSLLFSLWGLAYGLLDIVSCFLLHH